MDFTKGCFITNTDEFRDSLVDRVAEKVINTLANVQLKQSNEAGQSLDVIDNEELIKTFNISAQTSLNWRKRGLPFTKIGGKCFYQLSDIKKLIAGDSRNKRNR